MKRHVTTVTDVRGDSIVVAGAAGSRTIALTDVTALDVSTGTRTRELPFKVAVNPSMSGGATFQISRAF